MTGGEKNGVSYVLGVLVLTIGVLAVGAMLASGFLQKVGILSGGLSREEQMGASRLEEKLTLIHWSGGQAIVSNDCKLSVTIVRVYVDGQVQSESITLNAGEKRIINTPVGSSLVVETERGNLIKLRES